MFFSSTEKRTVNKKIRLIVFRVLIFITSFLIGVKTTVAESVDQRELERIVTIEVDYWMIEDQYLSNVNRAEEEHADQPETLTKIKKRSSEEESRLVQHLMDQHGLSRHEFESKLGMVDEEEKKSFFKKKPDLDRRNQIRRLKSLVQSGRQTVKKLELEGAKTLKTVQEELRRHEEKLSKLEKEETKSEFPWPKDEIERFSSLELLWWKLKQEFLVKYNQLSSDPGTSWWFRWKLVQEYRDDLRELMRSEKIQPAHYQQYQERRTVSLQDYIQRHPDQKIPWQQLKRSLNVLAPDFSMDRAQGMAMIVGSVIECSVPPSRCTEAELRRGKPLSGIEITATKTEGELTEQDVPSGGKMLLPPSYRAISDQEGRFVFPSLPVGEYLLSGESFVSEERMRYRTSVRRFFIQGSEEVLILDLPAERLRLSDVR